jgi:hypothetical protein
VNRFLVIFNSYHPTTGEAKSQLLNFTYGPADICGGQELMGGRSISMVDDDSVLLSDDQVVTLDDALRLVLPDLSGKVILTRTENLTIAAGPDTTGRVMFKDGSEGYLISDLYFRGQNTPRAMKATLKADCKLFADRRARRSKAA